MSSSLSRKHLNIGVYYLNDAARTEKHIQELAQCGVDFVVYIDSDRPMLDLLAKYGIGAIVNDVLPHWWGGNGENAGLLSQQNPIEVYHSAADTFIDHPAIWGISIGDEPSALDFPYYGKIYQRVQTLFPGKIPFLNLYPNYGWTAQNTPEEVRLQLGTADYAGYLAQYCANIPAPYISYDHYLYSSSVSTALENLEIVADVCQKTGRSLWIVLQVNSCDPISWISENQLRFQAFSALAFGAENILWACYSPCWWYNNVLDQKGEKTQQYEKLRTVNQEIHTFGSMLMAYTRTKPVRLGADGIQIMDANVFRDVQTEGNGSFLVTRLLDAEGSNVQGLFLLAAEDPYDRNPDTARVTFRCLGKIPVAVGGSGPVPVTTLGEDCYSLELASNAAVILTTQALSGEHTAF